jgi:hypothetical protein
VAADLRSEAHGYSNFSSHRSALFWSLKYSGCHKAVKRMADRAEDHTALAEIVAESVIALGPRSLPSKNFRQTVDIFAPQQDVLRVFTP